MIELDFTALNKLQGDFAEPTEPLEYTEGSLALKMETPATKQNNGELEQLRQMYTAYQQNIKRAGTLRAEIAKGIKSGEDPLAILLKAVEAISLMTGDGSTQNRENLLAVYGLGLRQPAPLKTQLEEAKHRLSMLTRPEIEESQPDARERIERAVKNHRELIAKLEREIAEGEGGVPPLPPQAPNTRQHRYTPVKN